ncbi:MAG: hypothetical protein ABIQ95_04085 [Bdellovibrionia bacterium]
MIKNAAVVLAGLISFCFVDSSAMAKQITGRETVEVEVPVKALLAPSVGYEERNNVEVVLYGTLPNTCYTLGRYEVERANQTLRVHQFAYRQIGGVCADESKVPLPLHLKMIVPFTNEVFAGSLPAGDYKFTFLEEGGTLGSRDLTVAPNQVPMGDTFPYASLSNAHAPDLVSSNDEIHVVLSGVLNSTCTKLNPDIRVVNDSDVFIVMPTITVRQGVVCTAVLTPFEVTVNLGKTFPGIHLIHARSMNGKAVSRVVQVLP